MAKTADGKRRSQKSVYPGITPGIASAGVQSALKVLEGRWKLTILFELFGERTLRFSELERAIPGITQKMLIQQLRSLERDGIIARTVHPVVPPKVEYRPHSGRRRAVPGARRTALLGAAVERPADVGGRRRRRKACAPVRRARSPA